MIEKIKELRVKIDGLSQLVKELNPIKVPIISGYKNSDEINKAYDSLILAKAWLGKVLGELGTSTPYANDGKRKDVKDIEPTADTVNVDYKDGTSISSMSHISNVMDFESKTHIEKVDWLRQEIDKIIKNMLATKMRYIWNVNNGDLLGLVYKYLCEARFWLGFELQRIKEV